ncbi:hypothetical protein CASFOL_021233 [Castilleja foliolosa]|uniref:Uncharacterized protein n=1 Tax=Castilleja foliolosa TaxID=1961234 RepID=A0ABD3CYH3_9LAMI
MNSNIGACLTKMPSVQATCFSVEGIDQENILLNNKLKGDERDMVLDEVSATDVKVAILGVQDEEVLEEKPNTTVRFELHGEAEKCCKS